MASEIRIRQISVVEEKRIVMGMIVSKAFLDQIYTITHLDYFTNDYLKIIASWCLSFYEEHNDCPYHHIKDIYEEESLKIEEEQAKLISDLLSTMSEQYIRGEINVGYLVDCAVEYFKKRELEITVNNVNVLKEKGKIEEAEREISKYTAIDARLNQEHIIEIGDEKRQEEIYKQIEEDDKQFFRLPGDLGKYLGNMKRGDVVGYYAPAKRGKCISGDSLIYLSNGTLKTVKEVVEKRIKKVLCINSQGEVVEGKISNWMCSGKKQLYKVTTRINREIRTTKDHRFLTPSGYKKLEELKPGDLIAIVKRTSVILWDSIKEIKKDAIEETYDLSIEKYHNFIADSFIVHNSWVLCNHFKYGVLKRKRTIFWSIEMTKTEIIPRLNQAFHPMVTGDFEEGYYKFPVFDCLLNQLGDCGERESSVIVRENEESPVILDPKHKPCTKCKYQDRFKVALYYDEIWRDYNDIFTVREKVLKVLKKYSPYGRVIVHPKYTLTYDKMMYDIEHLIRAENFIPDILIIDYVDILDIPSHFDDYRKEDERWKLMARLAGTTGCLVITATQANKAGHKAAQLNSTHQGGFYGKNRHVNLMVGLNQTPEMKKEGVMHFGITEGRGIWYVEGHNCIVLQDLLSGQAYLDAYLPPYEGNIGRIA